MEVVRRIRVVVGTEATGWGKIGTEETMQGGGQALQQGERAGGVVGPGHAANTLLDVAFVLVVGMSASCLCVRVVLWEAGNLEEMSGCPCS